MTDKSCTKKQDEMFAEIMNAFVESNSVPTFWKDMNGRYRAVSKAYCDFYEQAKMGFAIGKTDDDLFPKELADHYHTTDRQVLETHNEFSEIEKVLTPAGRYTYIETKKSELLNNGVPAGVLGFGRDVTEEHNLSEKLSVISRAAEGIVTGGDFRTAVTRVLRELLDYYGADRAYISLFDTENGTASIAYEVCAEGVGLVGKKMQNLPLSDAPFWVTKFGKKGFVYIKNKSCLKNISERDLKLLKSCGVTTLISVPLYKDRDVIGCIGADNIGSGSSPEVILTLANYVAGELIKQTISDRYKKVAIENRALLNNSPVGIGIYRLKNGIPSFSFANEECCSRVFCSGIEWLKKFCASDTAAIIYEKDMPVIAEEAEHMRADKKNNQFLAKFRVISEDGGLHWINCIARLSHIEADGTEVYYASFANIDQQMQAGKEVASVRKSGMEMLRNILTNGVICKVTADGIVVPYVYSDEFCRMMGGTEAECMKFYRRKGTHHGCHPNDAPRVKAEFLKHRNDGKPTTLVFRLKNLKGHYIWFSVSFVFVAISGAEFLYLSYTDVDDIKKDDYQNEQLFRSQQIYLDSVADQYISLTRADLTHDSLETISGEGILFERDFSAGSFTRAFETLKTHIVNEKGLNDFSSLFSRSALMKACEAGTKEVSAVYYSRRKDNTPIWVKSTATLMYRPGSKDIIAFLAEKDVNSEKIREVILNDIIAQRYDIIAYIMGMNNTARLISANMNSEGLRGREISDYQKTVCSMANKYVVPEDMDACLEFMSLPNVFSKLEKEDSCSFYCTIKQSNGELRYKKFKFTYLDRANRILALLCSDYTEAHRSQTEEQQTLKAALQDAERASLTKDEFMSRMSHELRTPMNAIIGLTNISLSEQGLTPAVRDHLSKISVSSHVLLAIINDILDVSRIEKGTMTLVNEKFSFDRLLEGVGTVISLQCTSKNIHFECAVVGETNRMYIGDKIKLQQMLINILGNAAKYTNSGGLVQMIVRQVSADNGRAMLRFSITDTGIGIDEDFMPHIFDSFTSDVCDTDAHSGTGLGLTISQSIARLMDGNISVRSVKGAGTVFTIQVMLKMTDEQPEEGAQQLSRVSFRDKHMLGVCGSDSDCAQISETFKKAGAQFEHTDYGHAVEKITNDRANGIDCDFIMLDWKTLSPEGAETAKKICAAAGKDTSILMMAGPEWTGLSSAAEVNPDNLFLSVPIIASNICLPANGDQHKTKKEKTPEADFTGARCLLAEDNDINREIAVTLLENSGFTVDTASNGREAVDAYKRSTEGYYNVILLDIVMPVMSGLEAAKAIRAAGRRDSASVPMIAMTANAFYEDVNKTLESGMNAHLSKPIEPSVMFDALSKFVAHKDKPAE